MKKLANIKVSVADGKVTITGDVVDKDFNMLLVRRVTVGHLNPRNMRHVRHVQVSDQGVFVKFCGQGFAMELDDIVAIASQINPKTSFAPVVSIAKDSIGYTATIQSELPTTIEWQFSADKMTRKNTVWNAVSNSNSVTISAPDGLKGNWIRCTVTNEVGSGASLPLIVK